MNTSLPRLITVSLCALGLPAATFGAAKGLADIMPPVKRDVSVKLAHGFASPSAPAPVPADLVSPFNPPDFDKPDPADQKANVATTGQPPAGPGGADKQDKLAKPQPAGDRAVLEAVAARIPALGMIVRDGKAQLMLGGAKRVGVGDVFTVTYGDQDYDLEVVAIDRTTFTLRYRGEEITRAIRLTK
jgi:hypothetical protein